MDDDTHNDLPPLPDGPRLRAWRREHPVAETLLWRGAAADQLDFVDEVLPGALVATAEEYAAYRPTVVGTHTSKSIRLPVYGLDLAAVHGARVVMRANFYDWKVSVAARRPVTAAFGRLLDPGLRHPDYYCEGVLPQWVFGPLGEDARRFTVSLPSAYEVYAFFAALDTWARTGGAP